MKKKPLSRLVAMLLTALVPLLSPAVNTIIYNATYDFNELTLGTDTLGGVTYTTVNYEGLYNGGDPGKPSLPIDYIKLSVPYNATNFTVTATLQNNVIQTLGNLDQLVYPCQPARMMNDTTPVVIVPPDSSVYFSSSYYPGQNAWVVDEGFLAGENHIVTIAVMPVSYKHNRTGNITTNRLRKSQTVRLTLSYSLTDNPAMSPIIRQDTTLRQEGYALTRSMVANPSNVLANAPIELSIDPMDIVNPNSGDGLNGGVEPPGPVVPPDSVGVIDTILQKKIYPYLIVTTPELKHSVRRIAALKRQKGYAVKIVTMNDVMSDPNAILGDRFKQPDGSYYVAYNDDAGKLRQYLKNAYRYWGTQYVLLAGKSIPYRHKDYLLANPVIDATGHLSDTIYESIDCVSDFYYVELNSDWSDSITDHSPELYVGRILCDNSVQIDNNSNKLFRYELNPGVGNYSYLRRLLFEEGQSFVQPLQQFKKYIYAVFPKEQKIELKENNNTHRPTGKEVIDTLNSTPAALIVIYNHGDTTRIPVYTDFNQPNSFIYSNSSETDGNGFNCLKNRDYPMIFYSPVCNTIPFDNKIGVNMGESFTTGRDYGGPVYIGFTRKLKSFCASSVSGHFAKRLKDSYYVLGMADALSVSDCSTDCPSFFDKQDISIVHAYLGDPSLELWTNIPQQYQNVSITRTDNSVTISGIDLDSTIVSCCNNNGVVIRTQATSNLVNLSSIAPNGCIMLYRHNGIPFIAPMVLQNVSLNKSQYVLASDVTAGNAVDGNRTSGDVIVKNGVEYEIEASGTVTLCDGFEVEEGATFAVYPSTF